MIKVFNDPLLLDYLHIAARLPDDERAQLEAFTGEPYDIDLAAVGNFSAPGPKWVVKYGEDEAQFAAGQAVPLIVGGFAFQRPKVWRDYLLTTPGAFEAHGSTLTRICRRSIDMMLNSGHAHRIECIVPALRLASRPELEKWYKLMGYNKEGLHYGYCANGADAWSFAKVKH